MQTPGMPRPAKFIFVFVVLLLVVIAITNLAGGSAQLLGIKQPERIPFSAVLSRMSEIATLQLQPDGQEILGTFRNGDPFVANGPPPESPLWTDLMHAAQTSNPSTEVSFLRPPALQNILGMLSVIALPLVLLALVYFMLLRINVYRR